ncbi:HAD-IIB family hydrolase [Glycomyces buryatensis]|uniref:HAD-IIB family hydrolase n=1 Tax=Glycomyces buryatensis TaxID=2570927 RepID=UPI0014562C60|nr:HAD-IIB family hydrolase [Glycomyces buryatensis]
MQDYSVIATDLDGTLLNEHRLLSERNRKALLAARARGFKVVAVTARTPRGLTAVPGLAEAVDAAICNNGALFYEPASGAVELRHTIPVPTVRELHERLTHVLPDAAFAIETGSALIGPHGNHYEEPWLRVDTLDEALALAEHVVEYRLFDKAAGADAMRRASDDIAVPGVVRWTWGSFPILEYNAAAVHKGAALADWCSRRGIGPESVIAFGDMPNDVSMLTWAGRSYAVAGAQPEALEAADRMTEANDEDGVAQAIEAILEEFGPPSA